MLNRRSMMGLTALCATLAAPSMAPAAENWSLYNHQSAPQFTTSVGAKMMADKITKDTNGEVKVRFHLAGTLQIATNNITAAVAQNVVQLGDDQFFAGNIPIGGVMKLPFLVQSYEEYEKAAKILQPYVEKAMADKGVVLLASYVHPLQYIWGRKEFNSLASIEGAKIRVSSPEQGEFLREFGGSSVTIGASEVPSALDRNVVDGIVTGSVGADLWQDMLSYGYLVGLNFNNAFLIANAESFNKLPPEQQAAIRKAAEETARWNTETMRSDDGKIIDDLSAGKMKIVKPSPQELETAVAKMKPYWEEWAKARGPETEKVLSEIRQALGR